MTRIGLAIFAAALFVVSALAGRGKVGAQPLRSGPIFDGRTPTFIEVGAAPTAGAGLALPPGSIAKFGTSYYWKTSNAAATSWQVAPFIPSGGSAPADASYIVKTANATLSAAMSIVAGVREHAESQRRLGIAVPTITEECAAATVALMKLRQALEALPATATAENNERRPTT
jgi:hypothetical protein